MVLKVKNITADFEDMAEFIELNDEAFPPEERISISSMLEIAKSKYIDLSAVYDGDVFIGYYLIAREKPCAYLFFFAISEKHRSKGYGTKVLELIKNVYQDYQIYIDIENIDTNALNIEQRLMRKNFYVRNGYFESGYYLIYGGEKFEILCSDNGLDVNDFYNLFENIKHIFQVYKELDFNTTYKL